MLRKEVAVIDQVIKLSQEGYSIRSIAKSLKIARNTVRKILKTPETSSDQGQVVQASEGPADWSQSVDWEKVISENAKGVAFKILHREHAPPGVSYHQFWYCYRKQKPKTPAVTIRLVHKAGEKTFFDFADGIPIYDRETGQKTPTQFLSSVLPFSSYNYGEFVLNQKQSTLMEAMERAWIYFGGVTPYVTVDNLKAGVLKAHLYDPTVNPTFVEFGNHWGFVVLPARPYHPRDKASNESSIGVQQRDFFQRVRDKKFYSLAELNAEYRLYLEEFNHQPMKDYEGASRWDRFQNEKQLLLPLASEPFERSEWKSAKVHADCHIQVEKRFYSVPFQWVGRVVRVRITQRLIEVFSEDQRSIASHARLSGKERVSTQEDHYPQEKVAVTRFEVKKAKSEADRIGPQTRALMDELFDHSSHPLKYLRRAQGILNLVKHSRVSAEALEYAAKQALTFKKTSYGYVKATATFYDVHGNRPVLTAPQREPSEIHLHSRQ